MVIIGLLRSNRRPLDYARINAQLQEASCPRIPLVGGTLESRADWSAARAPRISGFDIQSRCNSRCRWRPQALALLGEVRGLARSAEPCSRVAIAHHSRCVW